MEVAEKWLGDLEGETVEPWPRRGLEFESAMLKAEMRPAEEESLASRQS